MAWKGWENFTGTLDERQVTGERSKPSKYRATPTTAYGIRFDSKREAARYQELQLRQKAGDISKLEIQPQFPLSVLTARGHLEVIGRYIADFRYTDKDGAVIVEDAKGYRGKELYIWKRKHVEAQYGITVKEV